MVPMITPVVSHAVVCSKLYHGIWSIPMSNPIESWDPAAPCSKPCYAFKQCGISATCLDGCVSSMRVAMTTVHSLTRSLRSTDGICEFSTPALRSAACPGDMFNMYYICLPLKTHIIDTCYGLPSSMCYEDPFRTPSAVTLYKFFTLLQGGTGSLVLPTSGANRDMLQWSSGAAVTAAIPPAALVLLINDANAPFWRNYRVTANWRISHPDDTVFIAGPTQMVGITFRHTGNMNSGEHYMVGWKGQTGGASDLVLFHFKNGAYTAPRGTLNCIYGTGPCRTAPLPANKYFAMRVEIVGTQLTVLTNKDPLGDPTSDCSQSGKSSDPINCNGNQVAMTFTFSPPFNDKGSAGMYFAGGSGLSDDLSVRRLPSQGTCGDGTCNALQHDEDCINCPNDCPAPCGCGDLVCAGDAEALGCRDDCFVGKVRYYVPTATRPSLQWKQRGDDVAAYWSFDDPKNLLKDDSQNGLTLFNPELRAAADVRNCAPNRPNKYPAVGCIETSGPQSPMLLRRSDSAFGKLPVSTVDFTIVMFAKMTRDREGALLIRWGNPLPQRRGLALEIQPLWGQSGTDGQVQWRQGLHTHTVGINWNAPGIGGPLHHLAFTFDARLVQTEIFVNGVSMGKAKPCDGISVPQMVTFGEFKLGAFPGFLDDVKILSVKWTPEQVGADLAGGKFMTLPFDIGATLAPASFPTPIPEGQTAPPVPAMGPQTFVPTPRPTLGPMWLFATPAVKSCKDLCNEQCGGPFQVCTCHSPFAKPSELACDATLLQATSMTMLWLTVAQLLMM
jgi:hypothetical protein